MKHTALLISTIAIIVLSLLGGCKKADNSIPTRFGSLWLDLHTFVGNQEVTLGQSYPCSAIGGSNIALISARYYICGIVMVDSTGNHVSVPGTVLAVAGNNQYNVGQIPIGSYKSISFKIGVDSYNNHGNTTQYLAGDPLASQTPPMHFNTNDSGYYFIDVRGNVDTSGTGSPNAPFTCQYGLDENLGNIDLPTHPAGNFIISEGNPTFVHLVADFGQFFHSVDLAHNRYINPLSTPAVVTYIRGNVNDMFRYQQ